LYCENKNNKHFTINSPTKLYVKDIHLTGISVDTPVIVFRTGKYTNIKTTKTPTNKSLLAPEPVYSFSYKHKKNVLEYKVKTAGDSILVKFTNRYMYGGLNLTCFGEATRK
jgi:hypothetical protein